MQFIDMEPVVQNGRVTEARATCDLMSALGFKLRPVCFLSLISYCY